MWQNNEIVSHNTHAQARMSCRRMYFSCSFVVSFWLWWSNRKTITNHRWCEEKGNCKKKMAFLSFICSFSFSLAGVCVCVCFASFLFVLRNSFEWMINKSWQVSKLEMKAGCVKCTSSSSSSFLLQTADGKEKGQEGENRK